jgi:hypothetical protein
MIKLIKKHITILILLLLSYIFIRPYLQDGFIFGVGESAFMINPQILELLSTWNSKFGYATAFQANIFLYGIFWEIFSLVPGVHPSIVFIFLSFFLPGVLLYIMLNSLFKLEKRIVYLPACLLYAFNIFRLSVSYTNANHNVLFIFLPLLFLAYYKFTKSLKFHYLALLIFLSVLSSPIFGNLALGTIPYFAMFLLFVYTILFDKIPDIKKYIFYHLLLGVFTLLANAFWIVPTLSFFLRVYSANNGSFWSVLSAGEVYDHLRLMGFWAFRSGYGGEKYFPYEEAYYSIPLLFSTFLVSIFSFVYLFEKLRGTTRHKYIKGFTLFGSLVSFFMVLGTKGPFGFIYNFLYNHVPLFKTFREPYTKFMPLFLFFSCIGIVLSIQYVMARKKLVGIKKFLPWVLSVLVLTNAFPLFIHQAFYVKRFIEGSAGTIAKVPTYWTSAKEYLESNRPRGKVLLSPDTPYVSKYNWEYGVNVSGNIADYLVDIPFIKGWHSARSPVSSAVNYVFSQTKPKNFSMSKYLGLLNSEVVLQENDMSWRYNPEVLAPSAISKILLESGLKPVINFGEFSAEYLTKLPNEEKSDHSKKGEFFVELYQEPVLTLYKSGKDYFLPKFYVPKDTVYAVGGVGNLGELISFEDYDVRTQYVVNSSATDENMNLPNLDSRLFTNASDVYVFGQRKNTAPLNSDTILWHEKWEWPDPTNKPGTIRYFLVRIKENLAILSERKVVDKVDKLTWFAAKRIAEIKKFDLGPRERERLIEDFIVGTKEAVDYIKKVESLVDDGSLDGDSYWESVEKLYLYGIRSTAELGVEDISEEQIRSLYVPVSDFSSWVHDRAESRNQKYEYFFDIPAPGNYELLIKRDGYNWEKVRKVQFDEPSILDLTDSFNLNRKSLVDISAFSNKDAVRLVRVPDWEPGMSYRISFDYMLKDSEISLKVFEDVPDYGVLEDNTGTINWDLVENKNFPTERKVLETKSLRGVRLCLERENGSFVDKEDCYSHFEFSVQASPLALSGYIFIELPVTSSHESFASIRNIKVYEDFEPQAVLRRTKTGFSTQVPTISFSQVNPTKYYIHVENASKEYALVFLENFDEKWSLYKEDSESFGFKSLVGTVLGKLVEVSSNKISPKKTKIASHYNDDIVEYVGNIGFITPRTFETWGKQQIASGNHYKVNGYGNAWLIDSSDVGEVTSYDLILEYSPQKMYMAALFVSLSFLLLSTIYLVCHFFCGILKRKK